MNSFNTDNTFAQITSGVEDDYTTRQEQAARDAFVCTPRPVPEFLDYTALETPPGHIAYMGDFNTPAIPRFKIDQ